MQLALNLLRKGIKVSRPSNVAKEVLDRFELIGFVFLQSGGTARALSIFFL
jgi:hypothetical protein